MPECRAFCLLLWQRNLSLSWPQWPLHCTPLSTEMEWEGRKGEEGKGGRVRRGREEG